MTEKLTLSVEEASKVLGISRSNAFKLANENRLPVLRLGKRILVSKIGLEKMLSEVGSKVTVGC